MGRAATSLAADAAVKVLFEAIDEAVKMYESGSGKKLDPVLVSVLTEFVKLHGALIVSAALGKVGMAQARDALMRVAGGLGVVTNQAWIDCGIALFEVGVTGMEWTSNTIKVSRVASMAAVTGVGVPIATVTTVAVALFGILMTTKDAIDAANICNQAISNKAAAEKRPAAVINNRGYNLGQISTSLFASTAPGVEMVCK